MVVSIASLFPTEAESVPSEEPSFSMTLWKGGNTAACSARRPIPGRLSRATEGSGQRRPETSTRSLVIQMDGHDGTEFAERREVELSSSLLVRQSSGSVVNVEA
jgi:hypothetical protein